MENPENRLRWGAEKRLEFIEFRLFWEGTINRSDITTQFGVSVPQASSDLATYRDLAPSNLEYDLRIKRYVITHDFRAHFFEPNPDGYLAQLRTVGDGIIQFGDTWMPDLDVGTLPTPRRRIEPQILRELLKAIRNRCTIHIKYQSVNQDHPGPIWRWISPHAFAFDGSRWHTRAFCDHRKMFLDFVIGRCLAVGEMRKSDVGPQDDWCWHSRFTVILKSNTRLSAAQRRAIELDYGMLNGRMSVPVRYALLYYFYKGLRLDVQAYLDDPAEQPVVIVNRAEFDDALIKTGYHPVPDKNA